MTKIEGTLSGISLQCHYSIAPLGRQACTQCNKGKQSTISCPLNSAHHWQPKIPGKQDEHGGLFTFTMDREATVMHCR